ncbi:MAG: hypothetical protein L0G94_09800 [Brachybacterium sp.]|uniref:hypothetical protein n=1 Tax=Brachybacterium sp. TaxID=1891286 RepID=UPI00264849D4|nr:hypothetical protein [Brachybacterium sp.]MDN5686947.1 hypothetical protein [Brachybacterium sp.]
MTARRSEDPAGRDTSRDGSAAASYWTPARRREARPAQIRKDPPPPSPDPVDGAQDEPVRPAAEPEKATTSSDGPGAGTAEEGAEERGDYSGSDAECSTQK